MIYAFFLVIAILYNIWKFSKEKTLVLDSLLTAASDQHREMILSHHFHIFIFEAFLGIIIAHLISEKAFAMGLIGFAMVYIALTGFGLWIYQYFLKYLETNTQLKLREHFNKNLIKQFRVSFGLIILPVVVYSLIHWTFQDENQLVRGDSLWFVEFFTNIIFISVLTIAVTVIILLKLLPNREIVEPEYLQIIQKRLGQIGAPKLRVKWIEADIKNAFVVGLKLLTFSNQTMFIGRNLRTMLTLEEFDAVIAHELAHVANRHIHKRVIELIKNLITSIIGMGILMLLTLGLFHLYYGEDMGLHKHMVAIWCTLICIGWLFFNYSLFFDVIRSHEYEADAYAVIEIGASLSGLKSALDKLSHPEEIPDYLKAKTKKVKRQNVIFSWLVKYFKTHPSLEERFDSLERKIAFGLPYNHYVSAPQKIRSSFSVLLNWRVSAPLSGSFIMIMAWIGYQVNQGGELVYFIQENDPQSIIKDKRIAEKINTKPFMVGRSLMYYIVKKQNPLLIDYYLSQGADPGRTLIYLSESKNFDLFKAYYNENVSKISSDDYYLVLLKSADLNFTEGYRYLVNSQKFETLNPSYKAELGRIHQPSTGDRKPASNSDD